MGFAVLQNDMVRITRRNLSKKRKLSEIKYGVIKLILHFLYFFLDHFGHAVLGKINLGDGD